MKEGEEGEDITKEKEGKRDKAGKKRRKKKGGRKREQR